MAGRYFENFFARSTCGSVQLWLRKATGGQPGKDDPGSVVAIPRAVIDRERRWRTLLYCLRLLIHLGVWPANTHYLSILFI